MRSHRPKPLESVEFPSSCTYYLMNGQMAQIGSVFTDQTFDHLACVGKITLSDCSKLQIRAAVGRYVNEQLFSDRVALQTAIDKASAFVEEIRRLRAKLVENHWSLSEELRSQLIPDLDKVVCEMTPVCERILPRKRPNGAVDQFAFDLAHAYRLAGGKVAISWSNAEKTRVGGPFARFLMQAWLHLSHVAKICDLPTPSHDPDGFARRAKDLLESRWRSATEELQAHTVGEVETLDGKAKVLEDTVKNIDVDVRLRKYMVLESLDQLADFSSLDDAIAFGERLIASFENSAGYVRSGRLGDDVT